MKISAKKSFTFIAIVIAFLGFLVILGAFWDHEYRPSQNTSSHEFSPGLSANLSKIIEDILNKPDILEKPLVSPVKEIQQQKGVTWTTHEYAVHLKTQKVLSGIIYELSEAIYANGGETFQTYSQPKEQKATLVVGVKTFITHILVFTWQTPPIADPSLTQPKPTDSVQQLRAAIVIDDLGANKHVVYRLLDFQEDLTFSILPHLKESTAIATILHEHQKETLLHLPMEPQSYPENFPGKGAIMMNMSLETIQQIIDRDLRTVPFVVGVNNHMGSRLTANHEKMQKVLQVLRQHNLFFLDSRTTNASVAYTLAQQLSIPSAERKVFLDNEPGVHYAKSQLYELVSLAEQGKPAIAIGHPHETTLQALKEILPEFKQKNIKIIRASQLLN